MGLTLVTGATGFIGGRLVERLLDLGRPTACLVRDPSKAQHLAQRGAELRTGSLDDADSLKRAAVGVETVFHLAGAVKALAQADFQRANADGAGRIAQACAEAGAALVFTSSLAAAGPAENGKPRSEGEVCRPVSQYGRSKWAGEQAAAAWAAKIPITVVRPPCVFGPGDQASFEWFLSVHRGVHVVPGFTRRRLSLVHVDDLIDGMIAAAERGTRLPATPDLANPGRGIYYLTDPATPAYDEFGRMLAEALGRGSVRVLRLPEWTAWLTAYASFSAAWVRRRPAILGPDKIREAVAGEWICSAAQAQKDLGFTPSRALAVRLSETAEWYFAKGWLK